MKKNILSPDLDLLCKTLCKKVLNDSDYHKLSNHDLNKISAFLIQFNPEFSSSKASLNKSLQNWFLAKNSPSTSKLEEISKSLGYSDYHDFVHQNKRSIQSSRFKQSTTLSPFKRTILLCATGLILILLFPFITGISVENLQPEKIGESELLASIIQAVVVILFYFITRFSDFGGRDRIRNIPKTYPPEVKNSLNQFFTAWKNLWLSFSFLYIWFCILYGTGIYSDPYAQSVSDIITILSSLCFAYLFSVMDVESIPKSSSPKSIHTFDRYLIIFTIGLSFSSMMSILDRYYNLGFLDGTGTYMLGYTNVIVMLYFFGRLESHYLNVNRFVLLPLYTYAIIQIAYVIFFESKTDKLSFEAPIIGMVLILKGFLYFLIREWIKEGKLESYFLQQRQRIKEQ